MNPIKNVCNSIAIGYKLSQNKTENNRNVKDDDIGS